jgi:type I restriction enzyme S subunit
MSARVERPLSEFVDFAYGKGLPARDRKEGEYPVYGSAGVVDSHETPLIKGPGVIVGRKGTVGAVHWSDKDFFPIDTTFYIVPKGEIRLQYAYYLLKTLPLQQMNTDVAVPGLNRNNALRLKVSVPSFSQQDQIIEILSAYDDLIENNRRRIQLQEQAARLLYREWFVHLRFPGHEHVKIKDGVPEGWEKKPLGEVAPLKYGKALKKDNRVPGSFPVYGSSGIVGTHEKALVTGPAIIVGRKGNVGSVYWSKDDFHPIDTVYFIETEHCTTHLYYTLLQMQFINTDVAVPGLNRDFAHSRTLLIPDDTILALFEQDVVVIHDHIDQLTKYNKALTQARDLLLPRLMNGEVAV